jgi:mitochondrial fission protein ELM1
MLEPWNVRKPRYRPSLAHVDLARSDPLEPPWPDLILTVGRRPSMAALWVREQSRGRTRIVLLGKPSGRLDDFDLVILSGEVQMPARPNVLKIELPLMRVPAAAVDAARERWRPKLADLPRPLIAVLVGGPTNPFVYKPSVVTRLVELERRIVEEMSGTAYLTTSRRTPRAIVAALEARLVTGARLFFNDTATTENPYLGLLALADGFVVTADSLSMMVEVAGLRRPLAIFPLPLGVRGGIDQRRRALARWLFAPPGESPASRVREALGRALHRAGLFGHTRDFTAVHDLLLQRGLATRVGEGFEPPRGALPDDLTLAVERIRRLLER